MAQSVPNSSLAALQPPSDFTSTNIAVPARIITSNLEVSGGEHALYLEEGEPTLAYAQELLANRQVIMATNGPGWIIFMIFCWCAFLTKVLRIPIKTTILRPAGSAANDMNIQHEADQGTQV
ncbi:hypothetical protein CPB83DRAFT_899181 [Crepidotus variabilis]|uniref:Uncharacterized protein n=1 Tax=Crepidotus variabilis TaxID=179855 RepID=A0A9P6JJM7_9AGAR|nr:hypothetical protein CPB83DRAFT_899181 [Crepidotus variabilis]